MKEKTFVIHQIMTIFSTGCYTIAGTSYFIFIYGPMSLCPSVSLCHKWCSVERDGQIDLGFFGVEVSFNQSYTVF